MPGSSASVSARGSEVSAKTPSLIGVLVLARIAEGATGLPPSGCSSVCETRPTCHSCTTMWPPFGMHGVGHVAPAFELLAA